MNSLFTIKKPRTHGVKYPHYKQVLAQLTPEQVKIVKSKQIHGSKTSKEWLDLFQDILLYNQALSVKQGNFSFWATIVGIPLGLIIFFLPFLIFKNTLLIAVSSLLIMFTIFFLQAHITQLHSKLLADYFQDIIVPLMIVLHEETAVDARITLHVDLRHQKNEKHFASYINRYECYHWQMLHLSTQLYNNVNLDLKVNIRLYTKTNKPKAKRIILTKLNVQYPKKHHNIIDPTVIDQQAYKVKHREKPKKYVLSLSQKLKLKNNYFNEHDYSDLKLQALVQMIRDSYRVTVLKP
ncbi:hypothetical protein [uncultured Microscilla sp.]|uniref:hypothetical protein n=1 Tax=uncultured Microscilla sp. TaxID=432653 RepID=UPI0026228EAD|nr:hypothetical protein [uncultured Microscilla sp.]